MTDYERYGDYQPAERSTAGLALTFLFIGLGVGALCALLFTPKTGKQTRRLLKRKYESAKEKVGDWSEQADDLIEKGSDWAASAKEKVAPIARGLRRG